MSERKSLDDVRKADQVVAVIASVLTSISWKKIFQYRLPQDIIDATRDSNFGFELTSWFMEKGWCRDREALNANGYPDWVRYRITPCIDDDKAFIDGTVFNLEPLLNFRGTAAYGVINNKIRERRLLLSSCIGLTTLAYYSENPRPEFMGKNIFAWKSIVRDRKGAYWVPFCNFEKQKKNPILWKTFGELCSENDNLLSIPA